MPPRMQADHGFMSKAKSSRDNIELATADGRRPRLGVRLLGLALVIFSIVVATYLIVAYVAYESGRTQARQQASTSRAEQINRQLELARQDLTAGSDNLARTRLEWVLSQEPGHTAATALLAEIEAAESAPTAEPTPEPVEAAAQPTPGPQIEALPELQAIRRMVTAEQWEEALSALTNFRHQHPNYERGETDRLLYDTYLALGLKYVNTDNIELGLNYFSQAERLGNLPQEAKDYRVWADLYFQAVAYSGVNWGIAGDYWRDLCAAAPFFKDSCRQLDNALVGYGDQLAYLMDWCPAASIYQEAWNRRPSENLEGKLNNARENCAMATPIPITGTVPITGTAPITDTVPPEPVEPGD